MQQQNQQLSPILLPINIKTAFEELCNKHELLTCGIEKIDSILKLTRGDILAIIGNRKYMQMLVTRLCVNALFSSPSSKKNNKLAASRLHTSNVILVDGGNSTDFYLYIKFARQYYRHDVISRVLNNTIVTRPFTVYQLADIVINQLPKVIQQYNAKVVVISDLFNMFVRDPQFEANEARQLINKIVNSITRSRALEGVLVVVSLPYEDGSAYNHHNNKPSMSYNRTILPRFDKCIEIVNSKDNKNKMIDIKMWNNSRKIKNTTNNFHDRKLLLINQRDLMTVYATTE
jgi:RNase H-fold protein (predicted Holliday junction resolvase)